MKIGVVRETFAGERRVALVPISVAPLLKAGMQVVLESGAGEAAGFPDDVYRRQGAEVLASRAEVFSNAQLIAQVRALGANLEAGLADLGLIRPGQTIIGFADPLGNPSAAQQIAASGATLLAMELIPRITRAQSMDALSSMATVAGYKAVLLAAEALPKMFPMLMTAAGTLSPAKAFIMGTGVAGLQAIAMARRLGAVVSATDVRSAAKEQVQSLGAKFVESSVDSGKAEGTGGYAKSLDEDASRRQREALKQAVAESDVIITTAAVPGRKSPILLTTEMVECMAPGAVIVDLAAERGGNCELTRADQTVVHRGVTILGPTNLASTVPTHASQLYAKNVLNLLLHLFKNGELRIDTADEITRETLVTRDGQVVHPRLREAMGAS
ncbi:MAG TPA: Re/Si-specific NAD(P)(+) transhydrogenase subunit alpha [Pirellulales bacterium]|nr:Re/Si-specific NAD(P)(+) transhydrogenase subunit alpha [Pirellulales bacterium]